MSNRRPRRGQHSPQAAITQYVASLNGAEIPGDCDDCDAYQTLNVIDHGITSLRVHHDMWCSTYQRAHQMTRVQLCRVVSVRPVPASRCQGRRQVAGEAEPAHSVVPLVSRGGSVNGNETVRDKARRYLGDGRLTLRLVTHDHAVAFVRGDSGGSNAPSGTGPPAGPAAARPARDSARTCSRSALVTVAAPPDSDSDDPAATPRGQAPPPGVKRGRNVLQARAISER